MRVRSRSVCATGALVAVALAAAALPAQASDRVVLSQGHVDVLDVAFEDGELEVLVHDETVEPDVERDPDDVLFQVKPEAETTVPDAPQFAFLGDTGDPVWILPQDNDPNLLFAGLGAEEVEPGVFTEETLRVRLVSACGPADFSMFTVDALDQVDILADSGDGLPDTFPIETGTHQHLNWGFEAEGDYVVTFVVTGRLAANNHRVSSGPVTIRFHVGALS
jgi:surface-anchored protein